MIKKFRGHIRCTSYAQPMRIGIALALLAGPLQAGPWDVFVDRCLAPLEQTELRQPSDLEPQARFKADGDTFSTYRFAQQGVVVAISDGSQHVPQWCHAKPETQAAATALRQGFETWQERVEADGRYLTVEAGVLHSFEWREPVLEVVQLRADNGTEAVYVARDTELES